MAADTTTEEVEERNGSAGRLHRMKRWTRNASEFVEVKLVLVPLLIVLAVVAVVLLTDQVTEGDTQGFDEMVLTAIHGTTSTTTLFETNIIETFAVDLTVLGGYPFLSLLFLSIAGYLALKGRFKEIGFILVAVIGGVVFSQVLKEFIARPRPNVFAHLAEVNTFSFPSGHSTLSAVSYMTLGVLLARFSHRRRVKIYVVAMALIFTLIVGLTRMILGVHYPTDVFAGWALGLGWALFCWWGATLLQRRGVVHHTPAVGEEDGEAHVEEPTREKLAADEDLSVFHDDDHRHPDGMQTA